MGTHDSWPEVRRIFQEASDRDGADRDAFLATVPDGPVLDEVRSLLAWHTPDTGFLETPAAAPFAPVAVSSPASLVGTTLGPWRIVDRIGAGGMGVVYRAARADEAFERNVALKVIGALGQSSAGIERFRLERETLARLDHPAIARLLDGGTTPAGSPYFVMELVDGVPVDRYCDEQRQTIAQRIDVFLRICRGVQYAHRNLVVHRDLKPDNILVLADGSPKLLDFGVAKLLAGAHPIAGNDAAAAASTWALTPDFASPEQVSGGLVTTASDVYALGVLLHLLLTGLPPYRLGPDTRPAMAAALSSIRIAAPSTRILDGDAASRALRRRLTPEALARRLSGDLDAIILRARRGRSGRSIRDGRRTDARPPASSAGEARARALAHAAVRGQSFRPSAQGGCGCQRRGARAGRGRHRRDRVAVGTCPRGRGQGRTALRRPACHDAGLHVRRARRDPQRAGNDRRAGVDGADGDAVPRAPGDRGRSRFVTAARTRGRVRQGG